MRLLKKPVENENQDPALPPYLVLDDNNTNGIESTSTIGNAAESARQLQVADIYAFIEENLTKFAEMTLNSCLIFYGAKDSGKSTFLFQTSFFNMLTDQLFGVSGQSEGISGLNGAWI